jgi:hypothetical protein
MVLSEANAHLQNLIDVCRSSIGRGIDIPFLDFEYDSGIAALMMVVLRHGEAMHVLAGSDEEHFLAAAACARCAMETAATIAWVCEPTERLSKEGRWLGCWQSLRHFYDAISAELGPDDPELELEAKRLFDLHGHVWKRSWSCCATLSSEKHAAD